MKISILSHDLSDNALGRAYVIAKMLSQRYDVEIVGPASNSSIWNPVRNDKSLKYKIIHHPYRFKEALAKIDGDIIFAIKPKGTSFGYALLKKLKDKTPIILDIDDWESGLFLSNYKYLLMSLAFFWDINNPLFTFVWERLANRADQRTVSSRYLQEKFSGQIIPHARDTDMFDPSSYDSEVIKKELNLSHKKIILFLGTLRKHKGIADLLEALEIINDPSLTLMLIGVDDAATIRKFHLNKSFIKTLPSQPFDQIPRYLSAADLVVIPQLKSASTLGQIPAKLFDAMAMAKPIISTNVSDIPDILEGCGIIVEPGDCNALAEKIQYLLNNPDVARQLGSSAREKCIREYSFSFVAPKLMNIVEQLSLAK